MDKVQYSAQSSMERFMAPDALVEKKEMKKILNQLIDLRLTMREARAVRLYFKINCDGVNSYRELGVQLNNVTSDRARQIVQKALRKLKYPMRSRGNLCHLVEALYELAWGD